jgi:hypothetical protein
MHLFFMDRVDDPAQIHWKVLRKKNSKAICGHIPCHVRVNLDERQDIPLKFLKNDEFIRYMGANYHFRGHPNRASPSNLVPYYGEGENRSKWSPKLMQMHLKAMEERPEFQQNTKLKLRVEELALQYMLDEVIARHDQKKTQAASKAVDRRNNPRTYSPAQWEERPTPRGTSTSIITHVPFAAALEDRPKQTLRAGDVIAYCHPVMQQERFEGVIVTVNPPRSKGRNIAIEMQDSTLLPPTCDVRLVYRRLHGKMVEPRDKRDFYEEISAFRLDPSQNGKVEVVTKTDELGRAYREMQNELEDGDGDFWRDNAKRKQKDATENRDDTVCDSEPPLTPH